MNEVMLENAVVRTVGFKPGDVVFLRFTREFTVATIEAFSQNLRAQTDGLGLKFVVLPSSVEVVGKDDADAAPQVVVRWMGAIQIAPERAVTLKRGEDGRQVLTLDLDLVSAPPPPSML